MKSPTFARALSLAVALAVFALPSLAAERRPLVIISGQTQTIPAIDTLKVSAATTANASINIPPGAAPSAPNNGDCWTTTAGFYCQINGVTTGPYAAAGGLSAIADQTLLANISGGSAVPTATAFSSVTGIGSALKWTTARALTLGSDLSGSASFDGSAGFTLNATIGAHKVVLGDLAQVAANTLLGNWTGSTADVAANPVTSCPDTGGNHLNYVSGTGITCGTSGGGITALTGDATASGPGSAGITFATVNSNVGSFGSSTQVGSFTVNGKGLITAASNVTISGSGAVASVIVHPQGRLTLVSQTPVLVSDQVAKSTIYYDCHVGKYVLYYDGSNDIVDAISGCEVSLTMATSGTGVTNTGGVFDIWWVHSGTNRICVATNGSGGGWASDTGGSNTARGTGYSQVHNTRGYWTNVNSIASCYNGTTNYGSISADQATYLGTIYTTAAGQTGMAFQPAAGAGGSNGFLGVWNAYNRVAVSGRNLDSTNNWIDPSASWRAANNSAANRVSYVDGLAQSAVSGTYQTYIASNGAIAMLRDSTTATPTNLAQGGAAGASTTVVIAWPPAAGFHQIQAVEYAASPGSSTFYGSYLGSQLGAMYVNLEM